MNKKENKLRRIIREELKHQLSEAAKSYKIDDERTAVYCKKMESIVSDYGLLDILFSIWQIYQTLGENQTAKYTEKIFKSAIKASAEKNEF